MVRHLIGTCCKSTTVTHGFTSGRKVLIMPRCLELCSPKATDCDRSSSSSETDATRVSSGSGANANDGSGKTGADLSVEERLAKWKNNVNLDILTDSQRLIHNCHLKAVEESRETYKDPVTGYEVFTMLVHLKRGSCCGNVCRHCPYSHVNAPLSAQGRLHYNSAFYS